MDKVTCSLQSGSNRIRYGHGVNWESDPWLAEGHVNTRPKI